MVDLLALEIKPLVLIRNLWLSPVLLIEFPIKVIYIWILEKCIHQSQRRRADPRSGRSQEEEEYPIKMAKFRTQSKFSLSMYNIWYFKVCECASDWNKMHVSKFKNLFMLSGRISSYGCTWEVWRARKMRKSSSRRSREQLQLFECSPNFPSASTTRSIYAQLKVWANSFITELQRTKNAHVILFTHGLA